MNIVTPFRVVPSQMGHDLLKIVPDVTLFVGTAHKYAG